MPAVKSYAWAVTLPDVVAKGAVATILTPGFGTPENYQTDQAEVVHVNDVLRPEEFSVAWQSDFAKADVTNQTETDWQPGDTLYLTVAGTAFDPSNVVDSFTQLEERVSRAENSIVATNTRVSTLETRMSALETRTNDLETRVAKLEAQPGGGPPGAEKTEEKPPEKAPEPHKATPPHAPTPPKTATPARPPGGAPQHRGSAKT